jgi:tetratricopeptide (TPR) repeat protein
VNKALLLSRLGRQEEAIAVHNNVVERFGAATELGLRELVATTLLDKGLVLSGLGRNEEAIAVCDNIAERFGAATEPELRKQVAMALVGKAYLFQQLERHEEAIALCDNVIERFDVVSTETRDFLRMIEIEVLAKVVKLDSKYCIASDLYKNGLSDEALSLANTILQCTLIHDRYNYRLFLIEYLLILIRLERGDYTEVLEIAEHLHS